MREILINEMNKISEKIETGYVLLNDEKVTEACDLWLDAWDEITLCIDEVNATSIEAMEEYFQNEKGTLSDWGQDLEMELENAGLENKDFFIKRSVYSREFCNRLVDSDQFIIMSMKLAEAESYFELEDIKRAEELFSLTLEEYKSSVWPYLKWGDVYCLSSILRTKREYIDVEKALKIYKKGLGRESDLDYILEDRIMYLEDILKTHKSL